MQLFVAISFSEREREYKRQTLRLFGITAAGTMRDQVLGAGSPPDGREVHTVALGVSRCGSEGLRLAQGAIFSEYKISVFLYLGFYMQLSKIGKKLCRNFLLSSNFLRCAAVAYAAVNESTLCRAG